MADTLVKSLGLLARERKTLHRKERQLAQRQEHLIKDLDRVLQSIGYQLMPIGTRKRGDIPSISAKASTRKRLKCPQCERTFAHPLPMARHVSASHKTGRKRIKKAARRTRKKAA
jgi:uncharacterized C2H2 Zn-finger protein